MLYSCSNCAVNRTFRTVHSLLIHIRIRHAQEPGFTVTCGLAQCYRQFQSYGSFRKHVSRHHAELLVGVALQASGNDDCTAADVDNASDSVDDDCENDSLCGDNDNEISTGSLQDIECNFSKSLARFVLKFREEHNIPISVQNSITSEMKSLVGTFHHQVNDQIRQHLVTQGYDLDNDTHLSDLLDSDKQLNNVFENVSSEHMLKKFCKSSLNLIEPQQVCIGSRKFHVVSVCQVLTALLQNDDVIDNWQACQPSNDGYLRDYCDGAYFKEHALFSAEPHSIRLHMYIDEFEVANPIGANRGKHKMTAVYFTVGNLTPAFRSQQKFIFMALLAKHTLVKECKYAAILAPLVQDLQQLETVGVKDKYGRIYRGAVATVSADNLSAHGVAGFRQSFASGRICRFCMACKDEISEKFCDDSFVTRTEPIHDYHLQEVAANSGNTSIYGVTGKCPFSDLNYFSVTKCFPVDIMHDCLEGIIPFVLQLILTRLHENNPHLIDEVNKNMQSFAYSENDKLSQPALVKSDGTIIGSASEKWCFFRLLPFFLSRIPVGEPVWKLYALCREIMSIIFSPTLHVSSLTYLEMLICEHHALLHSIFPQVSFPAKMHYLIHYPRLISLFGPLRHLWCMRFESKHLYFKRIAVASHNFINITHTLSSRHQFLMCYQMSGESLLGPYCALPQSGNTVECRHLPYSLRKLLHDRHDTFWSIGKCRVQQKAYSRRQVLLITYIHGEDIPVFFVISKILYVAAEELCLLCGHVYRSVAFSIEFQAFEVVRCHEWLVIKPGDECESLGMELYTAGGSSFVTMQFTCRP